jgi:hypothetical protein
MPLTPATVSLVASAALLLGACGGSTDASDEDRPAVDESKPVLTPDGPLRGLILASEVRPDGSIHEPRVTFTTLDERATAVVALGDDVPDGVKLTIDWYRVALRSRSHLFSQTIVVGPGGVAFSEGVARAGLAPGTYETVAHLAERQVRARWFVREESAASQRQAAGDDLILISQSTAASAQGAEGDPPGPGDAGYVPPEAPDPDSFDSGPCAVRASGNLQPMSGLTGVALWQGRCSTIAMQAEIAGSVRSLLEIEEVQAGDHMEGASTDLCDPMVSDLPGTPVVITVTGSGGATAREEFPIPDSGLAIGAGMLSEPESGTKVDGGDTIKLAAEAFVFPNALGIESLTVDAGGQTLARVGNVSGSTEPIACDLGRYRARTSILTYRVPDAAPPVVEICASAVGFDGNKGVDCLTFPTGEGEFWQGTWDGGFEVPAPCTPRVWPQRGTISFTVAEDGSLSGTTRLTNETGVCGGVDTPASAPAGGPITGKRTEQGFQLVLQLPTGGSQTVELVRTGNEAVGDFEMELGGVASWGAELALTCSTCG